MTRHLHEPANALLYRALDLPAEERQRFVADACVDAPELLALVCTLLSRIDQLDEFLEAPLTLPAEHQRAPLIVPQPGDALGHWRVVRELGRGGMGLILLVERNDGAVRQSAALKIVQSAGQGADALARFQRERQILANLNHPDIARLIDAGSTDDGRPFFVMELSEGVPIDQYCAAMALSLRERAALFARVCHALHYAHQRLVIHRDLKPDNILVGPDGTLKLIDFGIASEIDAASAGQTAPVEAGAWQLTPLFASPEQLAGEALSVGSDIYSLGAILYRLLSGRSPKLAEASGIIDALAGTAPQAPSAAVSEAAVRHSPPPAGLPPDSALQPDRALARKLRGDLDCIVMKAIDLEPARRYASADEFGRDLQRYLDHQPLHASAPTWRYRMGKLVQRSPLGVAAAVLALCSVLVGSGLALWQARAADQARAVAEQRFEQTRTLARAMLFEVNDALEQGPTAAREKLVMTALAYLRQLSSEQQLQPDLRRDIASAYERIGDIAGNQVGANLGRPKQAEEYFQASLKLREAGAQGGTAQLADVVGLREVHRRLGDIVWAQGRVPEARHHYELAISSAARAAAQSGSAADALELLSRRRYGAAILYTRGQANAGQLPQALQQFAQLQRDLDGYMKSHPADADALKVYVPVLSQLADLRRVTGDLAGAQQVAQLSLALAEQRLATNPDDPRWRRQLSVTLRQIGDLLIEQGSTEQGLAQIRKALAIREDIAAKDGANERAVRDVAVAHSAIADAMMATLDYASAEREFSLARDTYAAQLSANPTNAALRTGLIALELARADAQRLQHHGRDAVQTLAALHALAEQANAGAADPQLAARIVLLEAQIQPRGTSVQAFAAAESALVALLKYNEKDRLDTYQLRESALAWQQTGEIGLRAGKTESACRYFGLAAQRYDEFDASQRLNAIDKLRQEQVQALRKTCV